MKMNLSIIASVLALSGAAMASTNGGAPNPAPAGTFQCASYVRTARPGVNYTFPMGEPMTDLAAAKHDALLRCANDAQARNWWMLCQVTCIQN